MSSYEKQLEDQNEELRNKLASSEYILSKLNEHLCTAIVDREDFTIRIKIMPNDSQIKIKKEENKAFVNYLKSLPRVWEWWGNET